MVQRMSQQSTFPLHDRLVDGELETILRDARTRGDSFVTIAYALRDRGVKVSPSTVHRWCHQLGIEDAA